MSIWGKIIGGAAGLALGGPLGALIGAFAGHAVDRVAAGTAAGSAAEPVDEDAATRKIAFTIAIIVLSAKMAKADGVVTRDEIAAFRDVFKIPPDEVRNVGRVWNQARKDTAGFEIYAQQIARLFEPGSTVLEELIGALLHIARADGVLHANELAYLERVAAIFGFSQHEFRRLLSVYGGEPANDPYRVLGIDRSASDSEVKSAYRALIRNNHPDRLIAHGMPEEFIRQANDKMAAINVAYDEVAADRGLN